MPSKYKDKDVQSWTTTDFIAYMGDKHQEIFGIPYAPMRNWGAETGVLGRAIGTKTKPGKYDKEVVRRFIDITFAEYSPTEKYPGTSFMFQYTYREQVMQRAYKDVQEERRAIEAEAEQDIIAEDVADWFNS